MASSVKQWREKRVKLVTAPSGDVYRVKIPSPALLLKVWTEAGVDLSQPPEKIDEEISKPEIVKKVLINFVLEPKIAEETSEEAIGVEELFEDFSDATALYRAILEPFSERARKDAEFFRGISSGAEGRAPSP